MSFMEDNKRPWGFYEILSDTDTHKVKRITVYPGKRLSLQRHRKRSEHWVVINGSGVLTIGEEIRSFLIGQAVDIPAGAAHRVENSGTDDFVFIEIQTGTYFGEDDIERIEDDFGRA